MRDEFSEDVKRKLAGRAGNRCSNPSCKQPTSGPSEATKAVTNVGIAAHITAASVGGPRYNSSLTPEQRSDIENGIWLCQNCAKAVDDDPITYSELVLWDWRMMAEGSARKAIIEKDQQLNSPINIQVLVHKAYFLNNPAEQFFFIKIVNITPVDVEVTHVWYENGAESVEILAVRLPQRLKPSEMTETYVPVADIPEYLDVYQRFMVKVSTGEIFSSKHDVNVRPLGYVAGR